MDERTAELQRLRGEIAAHLAWEAELGGVGLPRVEILAAHTPSSLAASNPGGVSAAESQPERAIRPIAAERSAPVETPSRPQLASDRHLRLAQLDHEVRTCTRCDLHKGRTQTVFSRGNPEAALMFIGEGPGQEEDRTGAPFVGPAGQLLDKMIAAMGLGANDVYICNVVKCRPPNNRTPVTSEAQACEPFLTGQIAAVAPRVIVALGRCAAENLGLVPAGGGWRGRWGAVRGIPTMPTYHPAFLLRSPEFKRPVWEDLQQVTARLRAAAQP